MTTINDRFSHTLLCNTFKMQIRKMTFKFVKEIYWIHRMQINNEEKEDKRLKINQMVAIRTRCIKTK